MGHGIPLGRIEGSWHPFFKKFEFSNKKKINKVAGDSWFLP